MQTLTIRTDNADFIEKAREILITLAKFDGMRLNINRALANMKQTLKLSDAESLKPIH